MNKSKNVSNEVAVSEALYPRACRFHNSYNSRIMSVYPTCGSDCITDSDVETAAKYGWRLDMVTRTKDKYAKIVGVFAKPLRGKTIPDFTAPLTKGERAFGGTDWKLLEKGPQRHWRCP